MELDEFLEHHGVKGQKWGRRKSRQEKVQSRIDATKKVASGIATKQDFKLSSEIGGIHRLNKKKKQKQAQQFLIEAKRTQERAKAGEMKVRVLLNNIAGVRWKDLNLD